MAIDTVLKEFKSVIRSLNWYLKRNKQYDTKNFGQSKVAAQSAHRSVRLTSVILFQLNI